MNITKHAHQRWQERFGGAGLTIEAALAAARPYNGWRNDSRFVLHLISKYGPELPMIKIHGSAAFIIRGTVVITVIDTSGIYRPTPAFSRPTLPPQFNAAPERKQCHRKPAKRIGRSNRLRGEQKARHRRQIEERVFESL